MGSAGSGELVGSDEGAVEQPVATSTFTSTGSLTCVRQRRRCIHGLWPSQLSLQPLKNPGCGGQVGFRIPAGNDQVAWVSPVISWLCPSQIALFLSATSLLPTAPTTTISVIALKALVVKALWVGSTVECAILGTS